jgi:hypothetical protein
MALYTGCSNLQVGSTVNPNGIVCCVQGTKSSYFENPYIFNKSKLATADLGTSSVDLRQDHRAGYISFTAGQYLNYENVYCLVVTVKE